MPHWVIFCRKVNKQWYCWKDSIEKTKLTDFQMIFLQVLSVKTSIYSYYEAQMTPCFYGYSSLTLSRALLGIQPVCSALFRTFQVNFEECLRLNELKLNSAIHVLNPIYCFIRSTRKQSDAGMSWTRNKVKLFGSFIQNLQAKPWMSRFLWISDFILGIIGIYTTFAYKYVISNHQHWFWNFGYS